MIESENPYRAPLEVHPSPALREGEWIDRSLLVTWIIVFWANVVTPLLLGWLITAQHGRLGMCVAVASFFGAGCVLCYLHPYTARRIVLGAMFVAVSQLFPVLHVMSGYVAIEATTYLESLVLGEPPMTGEILTEMGGFLATFLVGCCLLVCAEMIGLMATYVFPLNGVTSIPSKSSSADSMSI